MISIVNFCFILVGENPAWQAKGTKVPLAIGDIRNIYQGRWLNDQVGTP